MNSSSSAFMGIDLAGQRGNFSCALLDNSRRILFCGVLSPLEWQSMLSSHTEIIAAINSPLTLNRGFMSDPDYRRLLNPVPPKSRFSDMRVCEYQLNCAGISPTRVPKDVGRFTPGLKKAFTFTSALGLNGFQFWPFPNSRYQMFESHADATYFSLLKVKPFSDNSLEGRIQRQLLLQTKGIQVSDPMQFFEEITRHRLLTGKLPSEKILPPPALNALVAAYTAWVVLNKPAEYCRLGEPDEGVIILPENLQQN
ncbi:MAG: hypothetical protein AB9897_06965 [Anaerolineaceae bacterium]